MSTSTAAATPFPESDRNRPRGRRLVPLLLAFAIGWLASTSRIRNANLSIVGTTSGVVSVVNITGAKFCLEPNDGSAQRCGVAYERRDSRPLAVGDEVSVAIAELKTNDGTTEVFILER